VIFADFVNGSLYFAINSKCSAVTILLFELYALLSTCNVEFVLLVARWTRSSG